MGVAVMGGENRALTESIGVHALFADAVSDYDAGRLAQAAKGFAQVRAQASDHPGALAGLYQTNWQLGNRRDAEQAFSLLVAAGLDAGILSFKLLFRLGRTDFIDSDDLPSQYRMWIKSIGQGAVAKGRCVVVTGHASKSGPRELNAKLSLQRAERIVAQMNQMVSAAKGRFKTAGKGSDETVVGTGANDASDAIDRRVEFTVSPCG